jgi:hypothetical protein
MEEYTNMTILTSYTFNKTYTDYYLIILVIELFLFLLKHEHKLLQW